MEKHFDLDQEKEEMPRVLIVGADMGKDDSFDYSMEELKGLAKACGRQVVGIITQRMESVNKAFYVGKGKVSEIKEASEENGAQEVIFDNDLSPSQIKNLSESLGISITDRTGLILEIFALRAKTREAKLQVEAARLKYLLPRLVGNYDRLGRQGGASGSLSNKGNGETKLELDRRKIEKKIAELEKELDNIASTREVKRKKRENSNIPQVALVGYTNAGKSTIMNRFVEYFHCSRDKQVLEKDMLFATLDTSIRIMRDEENRPFYFADTVGFIDKLPHDLVKAFRSTLEEVKYADLIVEVVDCSNENYKQHMAVTEETLKKLGAGAIPVLVVYNKADRCGMANIPVVKGEKLFISASNNLGIAELANRIKEKVYAENIDCTFLIPYDKGEVSSWLMSNGTVQYRDYRADGIYLKMNLSRMAAEKCRGMLTDIP